MEQNDSDDLTALLTQGRVRVLSLAIHKAGRQPYSSWLIQPGGPDTKEVMVAR